ncbi:MAG: hypothetical protein QF371_06090 [Flavobacteriales bacterium]|nr:hypothetical protein [Flavobacteriales bacterium]
MVLRNKLSPLEESGYAMFDLDKNETISIGEVYEAIDLFFEGDLNVSAAFITGLIDYFFDQ